MKDKKIFLLIGLGILIFGVGVIIYGKVQLKHITYREYLQNTTFSTLETGKYKEFYPELKDFYIDDKIHNGKEVMEFSDYVVIAKVKEDPILYGDSIINQFEVLEVIKGIQIGKKEIIKVYENIMWWKKMSTEYLSGLTPVRKGGTYLLFLKEAVNSSMKDTYAYSSMQFGHVNLFESKILENYSNYSQSLLNISQYDYVFLEGTKKEEIIKYKKIRDEILQSYR